VHPDDDLTIISTAGQALRLKVKDIRQAGRSTMGTRLIHLKEGDTVASVARLAARDLAPSAATEPANGAGQGKLPEAAAVEAALEAAEAEAALPTLESNGNGVEHADE
jgi:DNA gyrase/topoisomerase IV subunit A